jgi:hypothetical protein
MFVDFLGHLYPRIYIPTDMHFISYYVYIDIISITLSYLYIHVVIISIALFVSYPRNYAPTNQQNFGYPRTLAPRIKVIPQYPAASTLMKYSQCMNTIDVPICRKGLIGYQNRMNK